MIKNTKIEIRTTCKECGNPLGHNRFRTFCSDECRVKFNNAKMSRYQKAWQKDKREKVAGLSADGKEQCQLCKRFYKSVAIHAFRGHGITYEQYKKKVNQIS